MLFGDAKVTCDGEFSHQLTTNAVADYAYSNQNSNRGKKLEVNTAFSILAAWLAF